MVSNSPTQFSIKLVSLGDSEVGKSCIIKRYCEGHFVPELVYI
jgi:GTPase SAR1 family protein